MTTKRTKIRTKMTTISVSQRWIRRTITPRLWLQDSGSSSKSRAAIIRWDRIATTARPASRIDRTRIKDSNRTEIRNPICNSPTTKIETPAICQEQGRLRTQQSNTPSRLTPSTLLAIFVGGVPPYVTEEHLTQYF